MTALRLVLLAIALCAAAPPVSAAGRHALLIGINDYQAVPDLRGAVNDIEGMRLVLTTRLGFAPEEIRSVTDAAATRAGILAALEDLVARAGPEDVVYLHYSGHGSQVKDVSGDEPDGLDETLIPHDGRTPDVPDITDDEIDELLARLRAKSAVIVLDSCHSGTATRGGIVVQQRSVPPDTRTGLYARTRPATRAIVPLPQERYVVLTGAASDEEALDAPIDGSNYGLFSYALRRSLASAGGDASPVRLMEDVARELERVKAQLGLRDIPEPQLEAPPGLLERPLLPVAAAVTSPSPSPTPAEAPARVSWVPAEPGPRPGTVVLRGAASVGAREGSLWALYPPGEREFAPGRALADAEVLETRAGHALARLDPAEAPVAPGSRAVATAPPPPPARLAVRWVDVPADRRRALEAALRQRIPGIDFVAADAFARFVIELSGSRCEVFGADGRTRVATLPAADDAALAGELASLFERSSTTTELLALDNPLSRLRLLLRAREPSTHSQAGPNRAIRVVAGTQADRYRIRRSGEPRTPANSLQLQVEASEACFLTLVDVDSEGGVLVLFPNAISESTGFHPQGRIPGGQNVAIPDSLADVNRAGFHLDYAPPAGTDTLRAFCSTELETARAVRDYVASIAAAGSRRTRSLSGRDPGVATLSERMRRDLARRASRGLAIVPTGKPTDAAGGPAPPPPADSPAPDWVAASLTLQIEE